MNTFEQEIANATLGRNITENRMIIKTIVKKWIMQDGIISGLYRDNEDIYKCSMQVIVFKLPDNSMYMYMDMMHQGQYAGTQLEKVLNDYASRVMFTTNTSDYPETFFVAVMQLISQNKLILMSANA